MTVSFVGSLAGTMDTFRGSSDLERGTFDEEQKTLKLTFGEGFTTEVTARLEDGVLSGTLSFGGGRFEREFTASRVAEKKQRTDGHDWKSIAELLLQPMHPLAIMNWWKTAAIYEF